MIVLTSFTRRDTIRIFALWTRSSGGCATKGDNVTCLELTSAAISASHVGASFYLVLSFRRGRHGNKLLQREEGSVLKELWLKVGSTSLTALIVVYISLVGNEVGEIIGRDQNQVKMRPSPYLPSAVFQLSTREGGMDPRYLTPQRWIERGDEAVRNG